ncbi:protein-tyrosine phosphatase-like protein, partial [Lineolata rhizophorae]
RNRYLNVLPYSHNRVKLKVPEEHSDYINASNIVVQTTRSGTKKHFIATQGPKDTSYSHIWRMIWHETGDPAVIVMLTQTHEGGKEKCFQYFPHSMDNPTLKINEHDEFGDGFVATLTLKSIEESDKLRSTVRELDLRDDASGNSKTVWHILFTAWPDFSAPEGNDRAALLRVVALSRARAAPEPSPRVVHCSAGVGRSGTFIALDYLLAELAEGALDRVPDDEDPVADLVERLREQRMMMVQAEPQFSFLYDALR